MLNIADKWALCSIAKFKGIEKLVTSRIYLDDVVEKDFEELVTNKDAHIKILVTPKRKYIKS